MKKPIISTIFDSLYRIVKNRIAVFPRTVFRHLRYAPILAIAVSLFAVSCDDMFDDQQEDPRDQRYEIQTPQEYRRMVTVVPANAEKLVTGEGASGVFVKDRSVILGAYSLAKHETTWELWKEVYDWALKNGYSIANPGTEGHGPSGTGGGGWPASSRSRRPVTGITWRDAVVWCNAYSELCGYEPVYHYAPDPAFPETVAVLRVSKNNGVQNGDSIDTDADRAVMYRRETNGFRLPTEAEWEFAARGGDTDTDKNPDWNIYKYSGGNTLDELAWYDTNAKTVGEDSPAYGAHPVGVGKKANRLGIFDMSGNATEWVWDWNNEDGITSETHPEGAGPGLFAHRVTRGGSWSTTAAACEVKSRGYCRPFSSQSDLGFRVTRTIQDTDEVVTSGEYPPTLVGMRYRWDSPWGRRTIHFHEDGYAFFDNYGNPFDDYYTYNPALGRGEIWGGYPAGEFQLRKKNTEMYFHAYKNYGHSAIFFFVPEGVE
jgi:formylglycine-generating enzyme required for sulfatase activity